MGSSVADLAHAYMTGYGHPLWKRGSSVSEGGFVSKGIEGKQLR